MKKAFPLILIVLFGLGVQILNAQENISQKTESPLQVVSNRWFKLTDFRRSTDNTWQTGNAPPSQVGGEVPRENWKFVKNFIFEGKFKNISGKKILGFAWDYVIYEADGLKELDRKKLIYTNSLKANKSETIRGKSTLPPNITIDAKNLGDKSKMVEKIEIRCLVFADKTNWFRQNFTESDCEDLRLALSEREKRRQQYGY